MDIRTCVCFVKIKNVGVIVAACINFSAFVVCNVKSVANHCISSAVECNNCAVFEVANFSNCAVIANNNFNTVFVVFNCNCTVSNCNTICLNSTAVESQFVACCNCSIFNNCKFSVIYSIGVAFCIISNKYESTFAGNCHTCAFKRQGFKVDRTCNCACFNCKFARCQSHIGCNSNCAFDRCFCSVCKSFARSRINSFCTVSADNLNCNAFAQRGQAAYIIVKAYCFAALIGNNENVSVFS